MKKKVITSITAVFALLLIATSCSKITSVTDAITKPTARQLYKRDFKDNKERYSQWEQAFENAKSDSIQVVLPYGEKGTFNAGRLLVYSYTINLKEGETLNVKIDKDSLQHRVFIDLFENKNGSFLPVASASAEENQLNYNPERSGTFKVMIQPQIGSNSNFFLSLNKLPQYGFPVAGKGNASIQSFWQDQRDGGKRVHEGIDIFAKRGTPVVAVADGTVSFTGERGLGGKQVWQRAGLFGNSIYYAHLDAIAVADGTKIKRGDTLGFVGNTGNARTTPPHLHFGIYRVGGAVDPLPFVYSNGKISAKTFSRSYKADQLEIKSAKGNLRSMPDTKGNKLAELRSGDQIILLGENNSWLHVLTEAGQKGFVHKSLVKV